MMRSAKTSAQRATNTAPLPGAHVATGWLDLPLLRYSNMINGTGWLVVTKLDVLDDLAEVPVCVGYKINGKKSEEIPPQDSGYAKIEPIYEKLPGWQTPTVGVTEHDKLPKKAKEYLQFVQKESGAKIGMVSTGPDREQTMFVDEFAALPAQRRATVTWETSDDRSYSAMVGKYRRGGQGA